VALVTGILLIRRKARRQYSAPARPPTEVVDHTPEAQLVHLATEVRESLITRFGPTLRARTTEEISVDQAIKQALGDTSFEELIHFLATADHWKFAPAPENGKAERLEEELAHWRSWHRTSLSPPPVRR
jgi:hypothetical protein